MRVLPPLCLLATTHLTDLMVTIVRPDTRRMWSEAGTPF
jgi:hypothetical protein